MSGSLVANIKNIKHNTPKGNPKESVSLQQPSRDYQAMRLIDTHAHLYAGAFSGDTEAMIQRARALGVEYALLPNVDEASIEAMLALEAAYPDFCFAMMGLHPCSVDADYKKQLDVVRLWLDKRPFLAVGEIGIDLYWDKTYIEEQKDAFRTQARWAMELGAPVSIHARESLDVLIELTSEIQDGRFNGVFHCFTGNLSQAKQVIDLGFLLGIGGVLTYKNSDLAAVLKEVPLDYIVLETDAPYLPPVPHRGKRNESAYVELVAARLAEVYGITAEEVGRITSNNAAKLFRLPVPEEFNG